MPRRKSEKPTAETALLDIKAYLDPADIEALEKATANLRDRLLTRLLFHACCQYGKHNYTRTLPLILTVAPELGLPRRVVRHA